MIAYFNQTVARTVIGAAGTALCAGICLFGAAAPAQAQVLEARSQAVRYVDLDLGNPEGRATLDRRIRTAARAVCGSRSIDLRARMAEARCLREAVDNAMPQIVAALDARRAG